MTMTLVSTVTVGAGGAASIDFTSIPQTGTDLLVVFSTRNSVGNENARLNINNTDITSGRTLLGNGVSASSQTTTIGYIFNNPSGFTADTFSNTSLYIPNYALATAKSISVDSSVENNATDTWMKIQAMGWSTANAITSLKVTSTNGNFAQYSTASLYTITKGSGGATVS